ncbi:MAG: ATP-dependent protease ATPase subunit HslU [Spirochaetales bacterium]|nr:ATP-dependent protease ATPase subunit HslU [Spirochaetales bacterium]
MNVNDLTPSEIVKELDKYIIGQDKAKRSVAIALRNRTRRRKLPPELRDEVAPKNIIMIGPTGVGKTEIARRLSKLSGAPFVKVEATKYTEVGYVGRDVESMIRDLMSVSVSMVKAEMQEEVKNEAEKRTEEALLDLLLPGIKKPKPVPYSQTGPSQAPSEPVVYTSDTREKFREKLRSGELEEKEVEIDVANKVFPSMQIFSGTNFEELDINLGNLSNMLGGRKKKKRVKIKNAREMILNEETDKLLDMDRVTETAKLRVEEMGIIFLDEIDKIASTGGQKSGPDVSREGVQRDILPIVEGSKVNTRYGIIDTAHILFIAAGAFHMSKPSDLIPELQGRFPLRVELKALTSDDFRQILSQPKNALIIQYKELLKTEGVIIEFSDDALDRISEIAFNVNSKTENIGARRLHTIMENLLEDVSFRAPEMKGEKISIDRKYVDEKLSDIVEDRDLSRYIL